MEASVCADGGTPINDITYPWKTLMTDAPVKHTPSNVISLAVAGLLFLPLPSYGSAKCSGIPEPVPAYQTEDEVEREGEEVEVKIAHAGNTYRVTAEQMEKGPEQTVFLNVRGAKQATSSSNALNVNVYSMNNHKVSSITIPLTMDGDVRDFYFDTKSYALNSDRLVFGVLVDARFGVSVVDSYSTTLYILLREPDGEMRVIFSTDLSLSEGARWNCEPDCIDSTQRQVRIVAKPSAPGNFPDLILLERNEVSPFRSERTKRTSSRKDYFWNGNEYERKK